MPLFRKKSQSQAERLASWRSEALRAGARADDGLGPLLEEIGVDASEHRRGWVVELAGGPLFIATIDDGTTLSGWAPIEDTHDAGELAALLQRNLDPRLVWTSLGDDELGARFAVPLDGFDRGAVLLALETMAATLGDEALAARAREARDPPRGEAAEQEANARAAGAVTARAGRARPARRDRPRAPRGVAGDGRSRRRRGRPARHGREPVPDARAGVRGRRRTTSRSCAGCCRRATGAARGWGSRRCRAAPGCFAACAVPAGALEPQALAWGVEQVLRLAEDYDERAGG